MHMAHVHAEQGSKGGTCIGISGWCQIEWCIYGCHWADGVMSVCMFPHGPPLMVNVCLADAGCDDSSVCTTDTCDPVTGCDNAPISMALASMHVARR